MDAATILIVDDEQPIVDLVRSYLAREGFTIYEAHDALPRCMWRGRCAPIW